MSGLVECFDVGGTRLRGALIGPKGIIEYREDTTDCGGDANRLFSQIARISAQLKSDFDVPFSIGLPGPVTGTFLNGSRPLSIEGDIDIAAALRQWIGNRRFHVNNDLNLATRAEWKRGQGRGMANFCLLTLSTGIGVGAVLEGRLVHSRIEIGHSILEPHPERANPCQGHQGCWVAHASGLGIAMTLKRARKSGTAEEFFKDPDAGILRELRTRNAQGLGNLINAFDPEAVFVMGSIGRNQFGRVIPSREELEGFTPLRPIPTISASLLGDEIGILGAYEAAVERGET